MKKYIDSTPEPSVPFEVNFSHLNLKFSNLKNEKMLITLQLTVLSIKLLHASNTFTRIEVERNRSEERWRILTEEKKSCYEKIEQFVQKLDNLSGTKFSTHHFD